jgi:hypothetical protein
LAAEAAEALLGIPVMGAGFLTRLITVREWLVLAEVLGAAQAAGAKVLPPPPSQAGVEAALVYLAKALMALQVVSPVALAEAGLAETPGCSVAAVFLAAEAVVAPLTGAAVGVAMVQFGLSGLAVHAAHLHSHRLT